MNPFGIFADEGNLRTAELALEFADDEIDQPLRGSQRIDRIDPEQVFVMRVIVLDLVLGRGGRRADAEEDGSALEMLGNSPSVTPES